ANRDLRRFEVLLPACGEKSLPRATPSGARRSRGPSPFEVLLPACGEKVAEGRMRGGHRSSPSALAGELRTAAKRTANRDLRRFEVLLPACGEKSLPRETPSGARRSRGP